MPDDGPFYDKLTDLDKDNKETTDAVPSPSTPTPFQNLNTATTKPNINHIYLEPIDVDLKKNETGEC